MNTSRFFACAVGSLYSRNDSSKYKWERVDLVHMYFLKFIYFYWLGLRSMPAELSVTEDSFFPRRFGYLVMS